MLIGSAMIVPSLLSQYTDVTLPSGIEEEDLDEEIGEFREENDELHAGVMFAVFTPVEVIHETYDGEQDIEEETEVTETSVFKWGSITKLLTWVSVMQLVEDDLIDLEEDVREYLPDGLLEDFEYDEPVTMIDLMNHQGGFDDQISWLFVEALPDDYSLEDEIEEHQPEQLYEPGEVTSYSNWGIALAGYIVETVSEQPFGEYVHENIFEPLGMEDTAVAPDFSDNAEVQEAMAHTSGYLSGGTEDEERYMPLYPAGAAAGTLDDLITFAQSLFPDRGGTELFEDKETLSSMFEISQYYGDTDNPRNAHGFMVTNYDNPVYGHSGNTNAYSSKLLIDIEEEIGYVMMTNVAGEVIYSFLLPQEIFGDYDPDENN